MKQLIYILSLVFLASFALEGCCKFEKPILKESQEFIVVSNDDPTNNIQDSNTDPIGITDSDDDEDHDKENTTN